jgi:signal transduction histidine kinase
MNGLSGAEFVLTDDEGKVVSTSQPALVQDLPAVAEQTADHDMKFGRQLRVGDESYFHSVLRVQRPMGTTEEGLLHVLFPLARYNEAWRSAFLPPLVVGVITIFAVALVTHWIARRISRDLATLGTSVRRLAGGEFNPLPIPGRDDELRDLTVAVNQAATRLSDYEQHVRQTEQMRTVAMLGAGLAHEMRNAATGCRLAVDLHAESCPVALSDDALGVAKSQLQLMENRLQGFLQLGKEQAKGQTRQLDFAALVDDLVPLVIPAARHAGVSVDWNSTHEEMYVIGQRDALAMVVVNLLLNAIEAANKTEQSESPRAVDIGLARDSTGFAELWVSDTGPGLSGELAESLFRPFVTTKPEGVGLGLAVAQQVAISHGGDVRWTREGNCTRFWLRLPLVADRYNTERIGVHA